MEDDPQMCQADFFFNYDSFERQFSQMKWGIQGDSDVFSIKQNLNSLHQGEHRFSHAFFTKVFHFRNNRKNVQF